MGRKVGGAILGYQEYQAPLGFEVTQEIQAWKAKQGPLLEEPRALLAFLETMVGKGYLGTLHMASQVPPERGVS